MDGVSVVRGRLPGTRLPGRSGSSQNIRPRVVMLNPSSGITGELWSQPPLGVAATALPQRSITSTWQVSPAVARRARLRATVGSPTPSRAVVGSPAPAVAPVPAPRWVTRRGSLGASPPGAPGRSSIDAFLPMRVRRPAAYSSESSASTGTSVKSGSPYQASRSPKPSFAHSTTVWTNSGRIHVGDAEIPQDGQLLQEEQALAPGPALRDCVAVIVVGERRLHLGPPARHVVAGEEPAVAATGGVHQLFAAVEAIDGFGDEALVPGAPRRLDLRLAAAAGRLRGLDDPRIGLGEGRIAEESAGLRHLPVRQINGGRSRPFRLEELPHGLDRGRDARDRRIAAARIVDRGRQHVLDAHGAELREELQPGAEGAGNDGRQQTGAGHEVEPELLEALDGGGGGCHALAADRLDPAPLHAPRQDRHLAAGSVQMRLHDLEHEARGDRRIERIAAALEDAHAGGGREPVRRGDRTEGAAKLRPCGEGHARAPVKKLRRRTG